MKFERKDLQKIFDEILEEKLVKKNNKYGDSIYDPQTIFNKLADPEVLISVRIDDKLGRIKLMDPKDPKYTSDLKEIIGYIALLINWRNHHEMG